MPSTIIGPDGSLVASVDADEQLAAATLDRTAPEFHVALDLARGAPRPTGATSTAAAASTTPQRRPDVQVAGGHHHA